MGVPAFSESWGSLIGQVLKVVLIKGIVFVANIISGVLKNKIKNTLVRGILFLLLVGVVFKGGEHYYSSQLKLDVSLFQNIGVERYRDRSIVAKTWRKKAKTLHPDRGGNIEFFRLAQESAHILKNYDKRKVYDRFHVLEDRLPHTTILFAAWESVVSYAAWMLYTLPFISDSKFLNLRSSSLILILVLLLLELFNIIGRTEGTIDPFDFMYPYMTLYQRGLLFRELTPFFIGLCIIYKCVFTESWVNTFRGMVSHCHQTIDYILVFDKRNKLEYNKQRKYLYASFEDICKKMGVKISKENPKNKEDNPKTKNKLEEKKTENSEETKGNSETVPTENQPKPEKLEEETKEPSHEVNPEKTEDQLKKEVNASIEQKKIIYSDDSAPEEDKEAQAQKQKAKGGGLAGFAKAIVWFFVIYYGVNFISEF